MEQTGEAELRTCVWKACSRTGQPTGDDHCQECGIPTELYATHGEALRRADRALAELGNGGTVARPLIVTMNDVPGYRITKVHGDVFGLVVNSRDYFANLGARFRTIVGGEVRGYTELLIRSRNEARSRLWAEATGLGANAVLAFRFDCNEIGQIMSEVAAYGTAVSVAPIDDVAAPI
jgi:uncharacterized protein YbjQ (UPF0145 family)